jgi:hypothetical protein
MPSRMRRHMRLEKGNQLNAIIIFIVYDLGLYV